MRGIYQIVTWNINRTANNSNNSGWNGVNYLVLRKVPLSTLFTVTHRCLTDVEIMDSWPQFSFRLVSSWKEHTDENTATVETFQRSTLSFLNPSIRARVSEQNWEVPSKNAVWKIPVSQAWEINRDNRQWLVLMEWRVSGKFLMDSAKLAYQIIGKNLRKILQKYFCGTEDKMQWHRSNDLFCALLSKSLTFIFPCSKCLYYHVSRHFQL